MSSKSTQEENIFEEALKRASAGDRASFLDQACHGDATLRARLDLLLEGYFQAEGFLTREPESRNPCIDEAIGTVIGRYKLLEKIGEGGFGIVYSAEQSEPVKRRVALKIIKLGMDSKQVVARFEAKRQALALMDHPNIAKVHDGGATETGRPYFVMELVRGIPITKYCDENKLSVHERLELFIRVCQAVQHAHQKGIIHRDLKPSNILVTVNDPDRSGAPKVIDFGVAKATQQELTEKTIVTQFHQFIGTPAYMSPEQAQMTSVDIDTRSDIYSLGVLLYELLTGYTPFDGKELLRSGLDEMRRTIREKNPVLPSTRLRQSLAGSKAGLITRHSPLATDLDWIVMKCLEKDRARRYDTANTVAVDIHQHLHNEPVAARPPTTVYRLKKLVRRNRVMSAAVALVTVSVIIGIVVSSWALVRERDGRRRDNERLRSALGFVNEMFNRVAPEIDTVAGASKARENLGKAGLKFVEQLRTGAADNPELRVVLARVLVYLSGAQGAIGNANTVGNYKAGLQAAEQAIDLLNTSIPGVGEPERLKLLVDAHIYRTDCLWGMSRFEEVVAGLEKLDPLLGLLEQFPDSEKWARTYGLSIRGNAGFATALAGRPRDAIARYLQPLLKSQLTLGFTTNSSEFEMEILATTYGQLAGAHEFLAEFDPVIEHADEGLRICEALISRFPKNVRHTAFRAAFRAGRGHALVREGRASEGLAGLAAARAEIEELAGKDSANAFLRRWHGDIAAHQARAFAVLSGDASIAMSERRERLAQAERYLAQADTYLEIFREAWPGPIWPAARAEVAAAKAKLPNH